MPSTKYAGNNMKKKKKLNAKPYQTLKYWKKVTLSPDAFKLIVLMTARVKTVTVERVQTYQNKLLITTSRVVPHHQSGVICKIKTLYYTVSFEHDKSQLQRTSDDV